MLALLLGTGCTFPRVAMFQEQQPLETPVGAFRLEYPPQDTKSAAMVREAIERASPLLTRWGMLQQPVTVRIHPDHRSLERAARRTDLRWLRAWSRYDAVDVQAPGSWTPLAGSQRDMDELLLHELTHSLMYQQAADEGVWRQKKIPAWFREGMASFTANQGYRWPTLEQLARLMAEHPTWEPLLRPEELHADQMPVAYGAAHHAFTFLVNRYGEDRVRALLQEMSKGPDFPVAFTSIVGLQPELFLRDFSRYVRLRGFKGGRLLQPTQPPPPP
ncbi:hypothetical protein [Hyalangium rubrum]|uniref:Peptidase MA-like domain-containing protein n=1 Tax=Hyalangium rubrum TaxID=3103134 RepID=A0ABU5GWF0_9BACT|nr:hypothetical protein [Hyalangium sp. s54d21]MDY7225174.1 hypothetical protein [Hyalangium sp. s54d21]